MKLSMFNQTKITLRRLLFLLLSALGYVPAVTALPPAAMNMKNFKVLSLKRQG